MAGKGDKSKGNKKPDRKNNKGMKNSDPKKSTKKVKEEASTKELVLNLSKQVSEMRQTDVRFWWVDVTDKNIFVG